MNIVFKGWITFYYHRVEFIHIWKYLNSKYINGRDPSICRSVHDEGMFNSIFVIKKLVLFFFYYNFCKMNTISNEISFTLYPAYSRSILVELKALSVKTLRCLPSAEFWRNCVLGSRNQRHALPLLTLNTKLYRKLAFYLVCIKLFIHLLLQK